MSTPQNRTDGAKARPGHAAGAAARDTAPAVRLHDRSRTCVGICGPRKRWSQRADSNQLCNLLQPNHVLQASLFWSPFQSPNKLTLGGCERREIWPSKPVFAPPWGFPLWTKKPGRRCASRARRGLSFEGREYELHSTRQRDLTTILFFGVSFSHESTPFLGVSFSSKSMVLPGFLGSCLHSMKTGSVGFPASRVK